ncbi:flagellar protein FliS [Stakelama sediminis]|uniref:Flagellar secretion chaperone FliS n=1 Tax=Stakelama sediminis TaxID=463200 RepID=A0A840YWY2_9SPHN|nr:flagellar export chaperone FliS [Stakelama sediminis]MBB5718044.1 flagellar protein FliS [Stakelama sediminis]
MTRYASALACDPAHTYQQIDMTSRIGGADPHQLVGLLYEEAVRALRTAAWATENNQFKTKSERVTRAIAVLFALESGLDFEKGGQVSRTLATLYRGIREQIVAASIGSDPAPFRNAANDLSEVAAAWNSVRN